MVSCDHYHKALSCSRCWSTCSYQSEKIISFFSFDGNRISLSQGQNPPFLGYCLPSWKILGNSNNVKKATFKSCNCKFTFIQTTIILKSCISWCGDSQTLFSFYGNRIDNLHVRLIFDLGKKK
jgi:hypothetical protein